LSKGGDGGFKIIWGVKKMISEWKNEMGSLLLSLSFQLFSLALNMPSLSLRMRRTILFVYEKAADGVVNITSTAVQMDFFLPMPIPTQGSGSGAFSIPKDIF